MGGGDGCRVGGGISQGAPPAASAAGSVGLGGPHGGSRTGGSATLGAARYPRAVRSARWSASQWRIGSHCRSGDGCRAGRSARRFGECGRSCPAWLAFAALPPAALDAAVGAATAGKLHELANGIDPRAVTPTRLEKSIGHEMTFETDLHDRAAFLEGVRIVAGRTQ